MPRPDQTMSATLLLEFDCPRRNRRPVRSRALQRSKWRPHRIQWNIQSRGWRFGRMRRKPCETHPVSQPSNRAPVANLLGEHRRLNLRAVAAGLGMGIIYLTSRNKIKAALYAKRRKETLRRRGLCVNCGHKSVERGKSKCEECRNRHNLYQRHRYADLRRAGKCVICGLPTSRAACKECDDYRKLGRCYG